MAQLVVRDLPDDVKEGLKQRAKAHCRSLEAEVRQILKDAAQPVRSPEAASTETISEQLIREQAKHPISDEVWEEFNRNLRDVRRSWKVRDVDFGK